MRKYVAKNPAFRSRSSWIRISLTILNPDPYIVTIVKMLDPDPYIEYTDLQHWI